MVFSSDLLDALTQDFFARKGNSVDNEPLYVEDIKVGQTHILCIIPFTDKYLVFSGSVIFWQAWLWENIFQLVETERGALC